MERFLEKRRSVRECCFFGFDWQFALTDSMDFPTETAEWRPVQLPHDWSVDYPVEENAPTCGSGGYARAGIGWYRRNFWLEKENGSRYALRFEGVYMNCDVWLNGVHLGGHVYGYTPFELEITETVQPGENNVLIRVNNSQQPNSRWYTGSGITREVFLLRTAKTYLRIPGAFLTTPKISEQEASVCVQAEVLGAFGKDDLRLETTLLDPAGRECAHAGTALAPVACLSACQEITVPSPARWDVDTPRLYRAALRLYQGNTLLDEAVIPFGIREIAFHAENGFLLNGRKLLMKGVCLHHDGGCVGAAVPAAIWERRLKKLKAMGCNALRCSHNPPDPALLDLADCLGFVVMDEAFDEWHYMKGKEFGSNTHSSRGYSEWFDACAANDLTVMVERDRNHPSVVLWSIGNEVGEQGAPDGAKYARMLAGLCHRLDPTRPITQGCDQMKAEPRPATEAFLSELDVVGVNYVDRWRERTETFFDEEKREHSDWLFVGTEDIAVNGRRGDYELESGDTVWGRTVYYAKMLKAEKLWKYQRTRPFVLGSFMWTGVDYLGECFWPHKGSNAGVLDTCGFEKDGYFFYQALWTKEQPVLKLFPHLNLPLSEGQIYPLIVYTNCFCVELLADGKSYGRKAYEFPNQGMTQRWEHFDRPLAPITTNDLHLSWDIPFTHGEITAIGYDAHGNEIARQTLRPIGKPAALQVSCDRECLSANGRDVAQLEIALVDKEGQIVPDHDLPITLQVENAELLGMDNGRSDERTPWKNAARETWHGLAYAVLRAPRQAGRAKAWISAPGLEPVEVEIALCRCEMDEQAKN